MLQVVPESFITTLEAIREALTASLESVHRWMITTHYGLGYGSLVDLLGLVYQDWTACLYGSPNTDIMLIVL